MEWALPLTTAKEIRCKSHSDSLGSRLSCAAFRPISLMKSRERGPMTPEVSTAKGVKIYLSVRELYFVILEVSAEAAAEPGEIVEDTILLEQKVQEQVASQIKDLPDLMVKRVMPSGRLPSLLSNPDQQVQVVTEILLSQDLF